MTRPPYQTRLELWARQELLGPVVRRLRPVLYLLAFVWRRLLFRTTFIAITGSLAKTTTKELLAAILETRGRTAKSWRNQNAGFMVALNVLRVRPWHRFAVFEVSAGAPGTLRSPARLLRPDVAVVLNVLSTHTTNYRDLDEHAAEKALLLDALRPGGPAILNGDDPRVAAMAGRGRGRVRLVGSAPAFALWADEISSAWPDRLRLRAHGGDGSCPIQTRLIGTHWAPSVLAALATAQSLGIGLPEAGRALAKVEPYAGRLQPVRVPGGATVIRDDYNAAIDTLDAALRVLESARATRRVLVITDFSDFARNRKQRLKFLATRVSRVAELFVLIGELSEYGRRRAIEAGMAPAAVYALSSLREAGALLRQLLQPGDLVILKGRTTDHATRILFDQIGRVECWKPYCRKTMLCDICWELGASAGQDRLVIVPPPGSPDSLLPGRTRAPLGVVPQQAEHDPANQRDAG
jgi:UDP-N-acetylmuramoyl-tripeptide--D-alanyl-D-alanine ligase